MVASLSRAILIAHRDEKLCEEITDLLREQRWTVALASNGHDAVSKILSRSFEAVLVDLFLPKLPGLAVVQRMRMLGKDTPAILVGKPLGSARRLLDEATALGHCVTTPSKDPAELARLLLDAISGAAPSPRAEADRTGETASETEGSRGDSTPHDGSDRREYPRVPVQTVVHYKTTDEMQAANASDVSERGMFVELRDPPEVGTALTLKFALPGQSIPLLLPGEVVRVQRPTHADHRHGMGIRFASIDDAIQGALQDFVNGMIARGDSWAADAAAREDRSQTAAKPLPEAEHGSAAPQQPVPASEGAGSPAAPALCLQFPSYEAFLAEYDANITHAGLFVPTGHRLEPGTKLEIAIQLPNYAEPVVVQGEVVCCLPSDPVRHVPAGAAIHLLDDASPAARLLHKFASICRGALLS